MKFLTSLIWLWWMQGQEEGSEQQDTQGHCGQGLR